MSQKHIAKGRKFPKTSDELHMFIAESFRDLLAVPENGAIFANTVLHAQLRALTANREHEQRAQTAIVLVKTEYPQCVRATVTAPVVEGELLSVTLEVRDNGPESDWVDAGKLYTKEALDNVGKLVLSQTATPGDQWYVTTNHAVDKAREQVSQMMLEQADALAAMTAEAPASVN